MVFIVVLLLPCMMVGQDIGISNYIKISGYVFDSINDEPIPFAVVRLGDINQTTNFDGYFVFDSVPKGNYTLIASFLGYCDYEIKINTDTLYNDLILKLSQRKYDDLKYFLAYRESVFFEPMTLERAIPNPNYKNLDSLMFPILELKNKSIEYVLDTVLAYIEKHRNKSKNKYLSLRFEKDSNKNKLMDISLSLYHPEDDDISKPDGVLKYKDRLIYVYGDFHRVLRIDKNSDKEGDIYYENETGVLDSIHFYFKQTKRGFEIIRINEYGY